MTGQKNRYTTTEKLWKLDDDTLKTPAHDEMVLWLLDYDNIFKLLGNPFDNMSGVVYFDPFILKCSLVDSAVSRDIFEKETDVWDNPIFIEVKPKIKSFGETLRQLRTYEHYLGYTPMLFTTDIKFKSAFESQGIHVLTYPEVV